MSKLLQTRLPIESNEYANGDTFNRLVRVLELSLNIFIFIIYNVYLD